MVQIPLAFLTVLSSSILLMSKDVSAHAAGLISPAMSNLRVTSINTVNGNPTFECWNIEPPLTNKTVNGMITQSHSLGNGDSEVTFFSSNGITNTGNVATGTPQLIVVLSGGVEISIPGDTESVQFGQGSMFFVNNPNVPFNAGWMPGSAAITISYPPETTMAHNTIFDNQACPC